MYRERRHRGGVAPARHAPSVQLKWLSPVVVSAVRTWTYDNATVTYAHRQDRNVKQKSLLKQHNVHPNRASIYILNGIAKLITAQRPAAGGGPRVSLDRLVSCSYRAAACSRLRPPIWCRCPSSVRSHEPVFIGKTSAVRDCRVDDLY